MEDLISKKEVLEQYGISYGALYRWEANGSDSGSLVHPEIHNHRPGNLFPAGPDLSEAGANPVSPGRDVPGEAGRGAGGERQQRRSARRLVVEDRFGQREFTVEEIQSARLTDGERESDILEFLKEAAIMSDKMDMRISGSSTMPGGEYGKVSISGPERSRVT